MKYFLSVKIRCARNSQTIICCILRESLMPAAAEVPPVRKSRMEMDGSSGQWLLCHILVPAVLNHHIVLKHLRQPKH